MTVRELAGRHRSKVIVRRSLATMVDFIVMIVIGGAVGVIVGERSTATSVVIFLAIPIVYYLAFEASMGRTVGKLLTGLKVVDERGAVPSLRAVLIRTATRIVEVNPFLLGGIPAGIIADRSAARQRWGDMLAGTYVLLTHDLSELTTAG